MTKLLRKEKRGVIAQLCSLEVPTSKSSISADLQQVLDNHSKVFETPKGMESIGLVNTYSPMVSLILWHFPEQFIVPPFATIT